MSLTCFFLHLKTTLRGVERACIGALTGAYPPDLRLCLDVDIPKAKTSPKRGLLDDVLGDGFLFAVPKHRRSLEKRLKRQYGSPDYVMKTLRHRKDLKTCKVCGDDHEPGVLCPTCYKKVIDETKSLQQAIQNELKLDPVENEVVVMYEGEKDTKPDEFFQGKRIVEVKKHRPQWFSENLLQKSTQKGADTSDVKPSELG